MRIGIIGQKGIPATSGGVERHVEEIALRLAKKGHDVTVYGRKSYGIKKQSIFENVRVLGMPSIPTKNLDAITATFLATLHALVQPYDVIHYHSIGPASLSWIIRLFKRKTILIGTFHSPDYNHEKWGWFARSYFHLGEWMICHVPHKTIVISNILKKYVAAKHNCNAIYIPNGCDVYRSTQIDALATWHIEKNYYILSVCRLVKHKGIHFLIEAFNNLQDEGKLPRNFKLVIVGASSNTNTYVKYLRSLAKDRANIIFTGEQSGQQLREIFSHAYLFAQPSSSEGLSIALLEAMGYGLTPLVSDIPENLEAIGMTGISYEAGNIRSLKHELAQALTDPERIKRLSISATKRALSEYDWGAITDKTYTLYEHEVIQRALNTSAARNTYSKKI